VALSYDFHHEWCLYYKLAHALVTIVNVMPQFKTSFTDDSIVIL